ncbi:hypothetical protein FTUN_3844 [Frigoriglobus tundricola]|uniref:Uncharacterized protein n=1 Tax=Frigoriglobus tundricola TaxID=2774151 RepID=A0A6M5YQH0_9BACT|nr:hypothetical protein FTUN_3844 [Frigoriglobus tundricola]
MGVIGRNRIEEFWWPRFGPLPLREGAKTKPAVPVPESRGNYVSRIIVQRDCVLFATRL